MEISFHRKMALPIETSFDILSLPVVQANRILTTGSRSGSTGVGFDVWRLIAQTIVTSFVFLIIIVWFTVFLNASVREPVEGDERLLQFSVYFTVIALGIILFMAYLFTHGVFDD